MRNLIIAALVLIGMSCTNTSKDGYITVEVKAVEQVNNYTYLLVKEKSAEYWVAVSKMKVNAGEIYRYKDGLLMEDFYSPELDKTFKKIIFLNELLSNSSRSTEVVKEVTPGSIVAVEKSKVEIEKIEGIVSIAELYSAPEKYEGKIVLVQGEVTKFNGAIMNRNWIHLQDGSEHEGKFDLTVTTDETFIVGSIVVVEGVLALNQDFGYGYSYEILLEKASARE